MPRFLGGLGSAGLLIEGEVCGEAVDPGLVRRSVQLSSGDEDCQVGEGRGTSAPASPSTPGAAPHHGSPRRARAGEPQPLPAGGGQGPESADRGHYFPLDLAIGGRGKKRPQEGPNFPRHPRRGVEWEEAAPPSGHPPSPAAVRRPLPRTRHRPGTERRRSGTVDPGAARALAQHHRLADGGALRALHEDARRHGARADRRRPGARGPRPHAREVVVESADGVIRSEGFEARCLQHELDHLDGLLFLDRVDALTCSAASDGGRNPACARW